MSLLSPDASQMSCLQSITDRQSQVTVVMSLLSPHANSTNLRVQPNKERLSLSLNKHGYFCSAGYTSDKASINIYTRSQAA